LQEFSTTGRETFNSVITFLTTKICGADNEDILFTYIRTVLEVFVLYSIITSDFSWIKDSRAAYIGRQTELMSKMTFSRPENSCPPDFLSKKYCLYLASLLKKMSRRERCRAEIIKNIITLTDAIHSKSSFMMYQHDFHFHQLNATAFRKRLKSDGHYWIAMTYSLASQLIMMRLQNTLINVLKIEMSIAILDKRYIVNLCEAECVVQGLDWDSSTLFYSK